MEALEISELDPAEAAIVGGGTGVGRLEGTLTGAALGFWLGHVPSGPVGSMLIGGALGYWLSGSSH